MKRMRDSLPKLSSSEAEMDELSTKGVSEEAVIKICELIRESRIPADL
jgi:hypothetical protein